MSRVLEDEEGGRGHSRRTEGWRCGCVGGCGAEGSQPQVRSIAAECEEGCLAGGVAAILSGSQSGKPRTG